MEEFARIKRLPPYVFNITGELKAAARVGLEVMDTNAACRTYNILAAEGRNVATAILLG